MVFDIIHSKNFHQIFISKLGIDGLQQSSEDAILNPNYLRPLLSQPTATKTTTNRHGFADLWLYIDREIQQKPDFINHASRTRIGVTAVADW